MSVSVSSFFALSASVGIADLSPSSIEFRLWSSGMGSVEPYWQIAALAVALSAFFSSRKQASSTRTPAMDQAIDPDDEDDDDTTIGESSDGRVPGLDHDLAVPSRRAKTASPEQSFAERLRSNDLFGDRTREAILNTIASAQSEIDGLRGCVSQGLLTKLQARYLSRGDEHRLRVADYTLTHKIRSGGMATVYRAQHPQWDRAVAIKIIEDRSLQAHRVYAELQAIQNLAHPHIVTALEVGKSGPHYFIAMEFIPGENVHDYVERNGTLSESEVIRMGVQIGDALEQAHERSIIHRDVKPGNIMRDADGNFILLDLGLSQIEDLSTGTELNTDNWFQGTVEFAAPEQAGAANGKTDARTDIYALGATLYFAATGKHLIAGDLPTEKWAALRAGRQLPITSDAVSVELIEVLQKMTRYDPEERYSCMDDVITNLKQLTKTYRSMDSTSDSPRVYVLVVEDSETDFLITRNLLQRSNRVIKLRHAPTMSESDAFIEDHQKNKSNPLVVLMDLSLPDSNYQSSIRRIAKLRSENVKVVAVSGSSDPAIQSACIRAGALGYLEKGEVSSRDLEQAIFLALARAGSR